MTRLVESDIDTVVDEMAKLDADFLRSTGATLAEIAEYAVGANFGEIDFNVKTSVVPITSGLGIIGGFAQTVAGILQHIGVDAFVTEHSDVWGSYEGRLNSKCQFAADDDWFMAANNESNKISENGYATGIGFAAALVLAAKKQGRNLADEAILVAGAGPVGLAAAKFITKKGGKVTLLDIDPTKLENQPYETLTTTEGRKFSLVLEATTSKDVINIHNTSSDVIVSAPGVPLGVDEKLAEGLCTKNTLLFNPLELGTATMMADVLYTKDLL